MWRRRIILGLLTIVVAFVLVTGARILWVYTVEVPAIMGDFAALWNATDALTFDIHNYQKWPSKWDDLSASMATINGDQSLAQDLVVINFQVDIDSPQSGDEWYVRLKSGRMVPEQQNANKRIRKSIEFYQKESNDKGEIDSEGPVQFPDPLPNRSAAISALP